MNASVTIIETIFEVLEPFTLRPATTAATETAAPTAISSDAVALPQLVSDELSPSAPSVEDTGLLTLEDVAPWAVSHDGGSVAPDSGGPTSVRGGFASSLRGGLADAGLTDLPLQNYVLNSDDPDSVVTLLSVTSVAADAPMIEEAVAAASPPPQDQVAVAGGASATAPEATSVKEEASDGASAAEPEATPVTEKAVVEAVTGIQAPSSTEASDDTRVAWDAPDEPTAHEIVSLLRQVDTDLNASAPISLETYVTEVLLLDSLVEGLAGPSSLPDIDIAPFASTEALNVTQAPEPSTLLLVSLGAAVWKCQRRLRHTARRIEF